MLTLKTLLSIEHAAILDGIDFFSSEWEEQLANARSAIYRSLASRTITPQEWYVLITHATALSDAAALKR